MMQQPAHPPHTNLHGHAPVPSYQISAVHAATQPAVGASQPGSPNPSDGASGSRKRKSPPVEPGDDAEEEARSHRSPPNATPPPSNNAASTAVEQHLKQLQQQQQQPQQQAPPPYPQMQQQQHPSMPHPHHQLHPSFQFQVPPGYVPVMPVPVGGPAPGGSPEGSNSGGTGPGGRALNGSKRAEQNRKAQRAFRERRDAHVKALESRSQLLDAALASVEEANRRWEEARQLAETLRMENAQLRAALNAYQQAGAAVAQMQHQIATHQQQQQTLPPGHQPAAPSEDKEETSNAEDKMDSEQPAAEQAAS